MTYWGEDRILYPLTDSQAKVLIGLMLPVWMKPKNMYFQNFLFSINEYDQLKDWGLVVAKKITNAKSSPILTTKGRAYCQRVYCDMN